MASIMSKYHVTFGNSKKMFDCQVKDLFTRIRCEFQIPPDNLLNLKYRDAFFDDWVDVHFDLSNIMEMNSAKILVEAIPVSAQDNTLTDITDVYRAFLPDESQLQALTSSLAEEPIIVEQVEQVEKENMRSVIRFRLEGGAGHFYMFSSYESNFYPPSLIHKVEI